MRKCLAGIIILMPVMAAMASEKTVITGDQMEIINNGDKVIFSGNSIVTRGDSVLKARRIVQDKKRDRVEASGAVTFSTLTEDREPLNGRADKALYHTGSGDGELFEGRPSITYHVKDSTGPVRLHADRIFISREKQEIRAEGAVEILTSSAAASAPRAVFSQREKKAVLSGLPIQSEVRYRDEEQRGNYFADLITFFVDHKRVIMEGNVRGKVCFISRSTAAPVTQ